MVDIAQLKDLIVNGVGRFIGKVYASEFIGKLTGNADTATTATDADKLDGHHGSVAQSASTYVLRDSNGYVNTSYINSNTPLNENPSISQVIVTNGNDHYYRKASLAHLKSSLGSMPANGGNSATVNGHTVNSDVPANAKFTDINTWRPLGTTADTACAGNDSRLSNARPASDVYAWAKASSKPSYSWSEITSKPSSFTPASHTHNYAGSSSAGGSANSLSYFKNTSTTDVGIDDTSANAVGYVSGTGSILSQNDGAMYKQVYSGSWAHEIYGDYRTGQIAVRGKNNGTWQSWRTILDSNNYKNYINKYETATGSVQNTNISSNNTVASKTITSSGLYLIYREIYSDANITSATFDNTGNSDQITDRFTISSGGTGTPSNHKYKVEILNVTISSGLILYVRGYFGGGSSYKLYGNIKVIKLN